MPDPAKRPPGEPGADRNALPGADTAQSITTRNDRTEYRVIWSRAPFRSPRWRLYQLLHPAEQFVATLLKYEQQQRAEGKPLEFVKIEQRLVGEWSEIDDAEAVTA